MAIDEISADLSDKSTNTGVERGNLLVGVHPEIVNFRMELSAVSSQQSAKTLFLKHFTES